MVSAAEYALRLANGEPLESVLDEVWLQGYDALFPNSPRVSPFTGETASE